MLGKTSVKIASRYIYYLTYIFQKSYSYNIECASYGLIKLSYCIFLLMQQRIKAQNSAPRVLIVFPSAVHFLYLLPSQHRSLSRKDQVKYSDFIQVEIGIHILFSNIQNLSRNGNMSYHTSLDNGFLLASRNVLRH